MQWIAAKNEGGAFFPENLIRQVTAVFEKEAEEKQITLEVILEGELRQEFIGDDCCLKRILDGLFSNAMKYTACGGRIVFYGWEKERVQEKSVLCFQVMDTGCGIEKEDYKKIFEKQEEGFYSDGEHLELSAIRQIAERIGGAVLVQSQVGRGTVFTVELPFERSSQKEEAKKETDDFEHMILTGKRVLVVEDDELNREITMEMLKIMGARVVSVHNGKEAVETFALSRQETYDIIMMDMQMPVMDGCSAARKIRAMEREDAKRIPIIALTGNQYQDSAALCFESGMSAFLKKPFRIEALERCLKAL